MKIACPVCSCDAGKYSINIDDFSIYKCSNCGLEHTYPIPMNKELIDFYSRYEDIRADSAIVKLNVQNNLEKLSKYGLNKNSLILDFGCGKGEFVDIAGKNCYGVELSNSIGDRIFSSLDNLEIKKFEYITLWGVLEHINDIKQIMKKLSKFLKKDAYLIITTVNAEGEIPYYYKPPEHLTYWTKKSLHLLAEYIECDILEISQYNMKQFSHIYLDRLLSRTPKEHAVVIKDSIDMLPEIIEIPTNELFTVLKKR